MGLDLSKDKVISFVLLPKGAEDEDKTKTFIRAFGATLSFWAYGPEEDLSCYLLTDSSGGYQLLVVVQDLAGPSPLNEMVSVSGSRKRGGFSWESDDTS